MEINKTIKIFYIASLTASVIAGIGGILLIGLLNQIDYGNYMLFTTFLVQLTIVSFGFQEGQLINYRKFDKKLILPLLIKDLKYSFKMQIIIVTLLLIIFNYLNFNFLHLEKTLTVIFNYAIITILPTIIIDIFRSGYISKEDFISITIIDIFKKMYFFVIVIVLLFIQLNIYLIIFLDLVCRVSFVVYLGFGLKNKSKDITQEEYELVQNNKSINHMKNGIFIAIGNWSILFIFTLDRSFLSGDEVSLGIYAQALFMFGILYQIIMPFVDIIFVKINEFIQPKIIYIISKSLYLVFFSIVLLFSYILIPISHILLNIIKEATTSSMILEQIKGYHLAIDLSSYLVLMIPSFFVVQLVLYNILILIKGKTYAFISLCSLIVSFIIYIIVFNVIKADVIVIVMIAAIINSIIIYFIYMFSLTGLKYALKTLFISVGFTSIYFLIKDILILNIIFLILTISLTMITLYRNKNHILGAKK